MRPTADPEAQRPGARRVQGGPSPLLSTPRAVSWARPGTLCSQYSPLSLALGLPLLLCGINSALLSSSSWVTGPAVGLYQSRGPERGFKKFTISVTEAKELTISQLPILSIMLHRVRYAESLNLASKRTPRHGLSSQELSEGLWHPQTQ